MHQDTDPSLRSALRETAEELRREFEDKLHRQRRELENLILGEQAAEAPQPVAEIAEPAESVAGEVLPSLDPLEELKHAAAEIDQAQSQAEVLEALMRGASRFASRTAIFLNREGGLQGWGASGFGARNQEVKDLALDYEPGSVWERIATAEGGLALDVADCASLCDQLQVELPKMGLLLPFVLGDRVAAALYFDRVEPEAPFHISALQMLSFMAGQTLETLPVRNRVSTGTLQLAVPESVVPAAEPEPEVVEPEPEVAEVVPEVAEVEPEVTEPEPQLVEAEPAVAEPEPEVAEPEPAVPEETGPPFETIPPEAAPEPAVPEPPPAESPVEFWTEAIDEELPAVTPEPLPLEPEPIEPFEPDLEIPEQVPAAEFEPAGPEPIEELPPPEPEEIVPEPVVAPEPEEEIVSEVTPLTPPIIEPPAPDVAATPAGPPGPSPATQVAPPEDVDGPGWAFTTTRIPTAAGNEALHEEARRLARLLVTEIKLYNEETVEEGRRASNVYVRLKEDIERSRQIYEDRIDADVREQKDYFQEALVRILAGGDPSALGI